MSRIIHQVKAKGLQIHTLGLLSVIEALQQVKLCRKNHFFAKTKKKNKSKKIKNTKCDNLV